MRSNDMYEIIRKTIICFCFVLCLLYPIIGKKIDSKMALYGTVGESEHPVFSIQNIANGSFQDEVNNYLKENISGRSLLIRLNNQLQYSLFNVSSNNHVVIGSNKQLYEPEYIEYSLNRWGQPTKEEIDVLVQKLISLDALLQEKGKQLFVFITPSKARYYETDVPWAYKVCLKDTDKELAYDKFIAATYNSGLNIFDSIAYIDGRKENIDYPLWYSTGIHWSRSLGAEVTEEFNSYLKETSGYDLGQIHVSVKSASDIVHPDTDLYNILNLLKKPNLDYYLPEVSCFEGKDKPNIFLRGGSFMGQSLAVMISAGVFNKDIHFENNYYFTDRYSSQTTLSSFDAYEEFDVISYLDQSDILVLEVNESNIKNMSWGFIDYILENYR